MAIVPIEVLMSHVDSMYRLVVVAAKRARQLNAGNFPLINPKSHKPTYIALEEIAAGKIAYEAEPFEGVAAKELLVEEAKPTWFRSLTAEEVLAEEPAFEAEAVEEEEEIEEGELFEEEGEEELEELGGEEEEV